MPDPVKGLTLSSIQYKPMETDESKGLLTVIDSDGVQRDVKVDLQRKEKGFSRARQVISNLFTRGMHFQTVEENVYGIKKTDLSKKHFKELGESLNIKPGIFGNTVKKVLEHAIQKGKEQAGSAPKPGPTAAPSPAVTAEPVVVVPSELQAENKKAMEATVEAFKKDLLSSWRESKIWDFDDKGVCEGSNKANAILGAMQAVMKQGSTEKQFVEDPDQKAVFVISKEKEGIPGNKEKGKIRIEKIECGENLTLEEAKEVYKEVYKELEGSEESAWTYAPTGNSNVIKYQKKQV